MLGTMFVNLLETAEQIPIFSKELLSYSKENWTILEKARFQHTFLKISHTYLNVHRTSYSI